MSKRWRIEVSAFGSDTATGEATVDAANWMTALKAGRAAMGETGGLPPGANLRHEADGSVTVHDTRNRKTYRLFPVAPNAPTTAAAEPVAAAPPKKKKARAKTIAYIPGDALPAMNPPPSAAARVGPVSAMADAAPPPAAAPEPPPAPVAADAIEEVRVELIAARDAEPNDENPLRYRERVFSVPPTLSTKQAEIVALQELDTIKAELEPFPTGKYVTISIFDHPWEERPIRPPMVHLDWKDWHGDGPTLSYPLDDWRASRPSSVPPPPTDPAERLSAAFEACQDLFFLQQPIEAMDFAVRLLGELLPADATIASLYDIDSNEFRATSVHGVHGVGGRATRADVGCLNATAHKTAIAHHFPDLTADPRFVHASEGVPGITSGSALYMAIADHGRLFGMIQIFDRRPGRFTKHDAELIRYIGEQLGSFMAQLRTSQARATRV